MTTYEKYRAAKNYNIKAIYLDMDGTIADLYGVNGWLDAIKAEDTKPYEEAKPMFNADEMAKVIKALKEEGYLIGVVTFTAWGCTNDYGKAIRKAKKEWLKKFFPYADMVHIVNNKREKADVVNVPRGYLLDDEDHNVWAWTNKDDIRGEAYRVGIKVNGNVVEMLEAIANNKVEAIA